MCIAFTVSLLCLSPGDGFRTRYSPTCSCGIAVGGVSCYFRAQDFRVVEEWYGTNCHLDGVVGRKLHRRGFIYGKIDFRTPVLVIKVIPPNRSIGNKWGWLEVAPLAGEWLGTTVYLRDNGEMSQGRLRDLPAAPPPPPAAGAYEKSLEREERIRVRKKIDRMLEYRMELVRKNWKHSSTPTHYLELDGLADLRDSLAR